MNACNRTQEGRMQTWLNKLPDNNECTTPATWQNEICQWSNLDIWSQSTCHSILHCMQGCLPHYASFRSTRQHNPGSCNQWLARRPTQFLGALNKGQLRLEHGSLHVPQGMLCCDLPSPLKALRNAGITETSVLPSPVLISAIPPS